MKVPSASALLGVVLLFAALPVMAEEPLAKPPALATPAAPDTKETYIRNAQDTMSGWKRELDATGTKVGKATTREADAAWSKAKTEADKLGTATSDGWDRTKSSFESAARAFTETFNRTKTR